MIDEIEQQANVIIIPLIDSVEENSIDSRSTISNDTEGQIPRITIPLRVDWALIVNHQSFGVEYKDFIRKENFYQLILTCFFVMNFRERIRWRSRD